jgi:hypothetical protein
MRMKSLVRQATVSVLTIELLCALTFACASLWHEWEARLRALDLSLQGRSDSLIGAVQDAEDPLDSVKIDPEEFTPGRNDEFAVYNPDGRLVGASSGDHSALSIQNRNGFRNVRQVPGQDRMDIFIVHAPLSAAALSPCRSFYQRGRFRLPVSSLGLAV